jgi:hypothetical protein
VGGVEAYLCRAAICRVHSGPGSCGAGEGRIPTHPNHWAPLSWVTHDPTWNAPRPRRHCSKLPVRLCPKPSYKFRWAVSVYTKHTRARAHTHTYTRTHTHTRTHRDATRPPPRTQTQGKMEMEMHRHGLHLRHRRMAPVESRLRAVDHPVHPADCHGHHATTH